MDLQKIHPAKHAALLFSGLILAVVGIALAIIGFVAAIGLLWAFGRFCAKWLGVY